jgi:predicted dienelactone hydrolase
MWRASWLGIGAWVLLLPGAAQADAADCYQASGKAGVRCLDRYLKPIEKCRRKADTACEDALRVENGPLSEVLAAGASSLLQRCDAESAAALGFSNLDDVLVRSAESCEDFGEDFLGLAYAADLPALSSEEASCQRHVARQLGGLRKKAVAAFGKQCLAKTGRGRPCDAEKRDRKVEARRGKAASKILAKCALPGVTDDVPALTADVVTRAKHYAQRVYPPTDLGSAATFGPFPIGVRTLQLEDESRLNVDGDAARPVVLEVYYPSTEAAVAGLPGDIASVIGIEIVETPAIRDVAVAPGQFPIVLFSHGNGGVRFQSFFFAAHLASHGFVVASPDHHGNTLLDGIVGVDDPDSATNRPLDMSFVIDQLEAFQIEKGHFLEGALDLAKIGMSGHSFGGYTAFALAGGSFPLGTFTEPRIKAIYPQAPSASGFGEGFFDTITIPTLVVGGSLDETTPFPSNQQLPFDGLPAGAAVVGLANLENAGHFSFSDFCEVPRDILEFVGGFDEACEPRHLPWRYAQDIINFLALYFFDATLNGSAEALAELDPARLAAIGDLDYQSK